MGESESVRGEKLLAAVAAFGMAMDELGIVFAAVTMDELKQKANSTTLGYFGNVGQGSGELLLKTFLSIKANPQHDVACQKVVRQQTGLTQ